LDRGPAHGLSGQLVNHFTGKDGWQIPFQLTDDMLHVYSMAVVIEYASRTCGSSTLQQISGHAYFGNLVIQIILLPNSFVERPWVPLDCSL
jgi:hypothetical protein